MEPRTLAALKDSIAHWERMATGNQGSEEEPTGRFCALCREFFRKNKDCEGCPVSSLTGKEDCEDTPYWDAKDEWDEYGYSDSFRKLAMIQLQFLKSLLPKEEQ